MTTPGSHNDAYASSYHRLFFQNRARGKPLHECAPLWKTRPVLPRPAQPRRLIGRGWPELGAA